MARKKKSPSKKSGKHDRQTSEKTKSGGQQAEESSSTYDPDSKANLSDLKESLSNVLYEIPGHTLSSGENFTKIERLSRVFRPVINKSMVANMEGQMTANRSIRESLSYLNSSDPTNHLFAHGVLTTTVDDHFQYFDVCSRFGIALYKVYVMMSSSPVADSVIPVEFRAQILEFLKWVTKYNKENIYGSKDREEFRGLELSESSIYDYAIENKDYRSANQLTEALINKADPEREIGLSAPDESSSTDCDSKATGDMDESSADGSSSTITISSSSGTTETKNKSKSRQRVESLAFSTNTTSINETYRPKGGTAASSSLNSLGDQSGVTVNLMKSLKAEVTNPVKRRTGDAKDNDGLLLAKAEVQKMEAGRVIMAESVTGGFYEMFYIAAVQQDLCTFVALFFAFDHSGIKELAPLCDRGLLGALEILTKQHPLQYLDKYGYHGYSQRLWELGMSKMYKTTAVLKQQVYDYVHSVQNSKENIITIPRGLEQPEDLLDAIENVLDCLATVSDVCRYTSIEIEPDQLAVIMDQIWIHAFGTVKDATVQDVFRSFRDAFNKLTDMHVAEEFEARRFEGMDSFEHTMSNTTQFSECGQPITAATQLMESLEMEYPKLPQHIGKRAFFEFVQVNNNTERWKQSVEKVYDDLHTENVESNRASSSGASTKRQPRRRAQLKSKKPTSSPAPKDPPVEKEDDESRLAKLAPILSMYAKHNARSGSSRTSYSGPCHRHIRQGDPGEQGGPGAYFNEGCKQKLLDAAERTKGGTKEQQKAALIKACRGMTDQNKPGEHDYRDACDVPEPLMDDFMGSACKACNRTAIVVFEGTNVANHGIWIGHGQGASGKPLPPQCPCNEGRSKKEIVKRDGLLLSWHDSIEKGNTVYMKISEVDSLVDRYSPAAVVAIRATICGKLPNRTLEFGDYSKVASANSTNTSSLPLTAAAGTSAPSAPPNAWSSGQGTTTGDPYAAQLAELTANFTKQASLIASLTSANEALSAQLQSSKSEVTRLARQWADAGLQQGQSVNFSGPGYVDPQWGDTNPKFDRPGAVAMPAFVANTPVTDGKQANSVLREANVSHQAMKSVYPIQMVREATMLGQSDLATWNPNHLSDQERMAEEYMVSFTAQPHRAVRMTLHDILRCQNL